MKGAIGAALTHMRQVRDKTGPAIAVAYSGGKDSICVLWCATRVFSRVEPFYLGVVPGLECIEGPMRANAARLGCPEVHVLPETTAQRWGLYRPAPMRVPALGMTELYDGARSLLDCPWVANGWRADDSMDRRVVIKADGPVNERMKVVHPIAHWSTSDVHDLMQGIGALAPMTFGTQRSTGFNLNAETLTALAERYPDDYAKVCEQFPFAPAIVYRAKKWGVGFLEARKNRRTDEA